MRVLSKRPRPCFLSAASAKVYISHGVHLPVQGFFDLNTRKCAHTMQENFNQFHSPLQTFDSHTSPPLQAIEPETRVRKITRGEHNDIGKLTAGSLYIVLYSRGIVAPPDGRGEFHWAFYLHINEFEGGWKLHVTNAGSAQNWIAEPSKEKNVFGAFLLVGMVKIRTFQVDAVENIKSIIQAEDDQLNQIPGLTCRTWVFRACERLRQYGHLSYPNLQDLEQEMWTFGREHWDDANQNVQPRPFIDSQVCEI